MVINMENIISELRIGSYQILKDHFYFTDE